MDAFLFAMMAVFLISLGGRDQLLVAQFAQRSDASSIVPVMAGLISIASAAAMCAAGAVMAALLPQRAAAMLVAFALVIAAVELLRPIKMKSMSEPTRSLGAIGLVLIGRQMRDSARFAVFALAAHSVSPLFVGIGAVIGGIGSVAFGWYAADVLVDKLPLRMIRLAFGSVLLIFAIFLAINARYAVM